MKVLFVAFSAIIWFVIKLSDESYSETLEYEIVVKSNAPDIVIANAIIPVKFQVHSNGFELLSESFNRKKRIEVSLDISENDQREVYFNLNEKRNFFESKLGDDLKITDISPGAVRLKVDILGKKKVDVNVDYNLKIKSPYSLHGEIQVEPGQVTLYAPTAFLNNIEILTTEIVEIDSDEEHQSYEVEIIVPDIPHVSVKPNTVKIKVNVLPYTEKFIKVPIQKINAPFNAEVKLFPAFITVRCNVAVTEFDEINASQFICLADLSQVGKDKKRIGLELSKIPENVKLIDWGDKSVEYLMIQ